jgi:hypothetical protein
MYATPWRSPKCIVHGISQNTGRDGNPADLEREPMNPIDFIKTLVVAFVTLFPVVNPIGDAPIFLSLTERYPQSAQKVLARKIAAYGFILLAVSFLFGSIILDFFAFPCPWYRLREG